MRELADILSCEYCLLNCDFDRAAKKAVNAQSGRKDTPFLLCTQNLANILWTHGNFILYLSFHFPEMAVHAAHQNALGAIADFHEEADGPLTEVNAERRNLIAQPEMDIVVRAEASPLKMEPFDITTDASFGIKGDVFANEPRVFHHGHHTEVVTIDAAAPLFQQAPMALRGGRGFILRVGNTETIYRRPAHKSTRGYAIVEMVQIMAAKRETEAVKESILVQKISALLFPGIILESVESVHTCKESYRETELMTLEVATVVFETIDVSVLCVLRCQRA